MGNLQAPNMEEENLILDGTHLPCDQTLLKEIPINVSKYK
jgi:hypothetical protein